MGLPGPTCEAEIELDFRRGDSMLGRGWASFALPRALDTWPFVNIHGSTTRQVLPRQCCDAPDPLQVTAMPTLSIKLPEETKQRSQSVARSQGTTVHAVMVNAIESALCKAEHQYSLVADALRGRR